MTALEVLEDLKRYLNNEHTEVNLFREILDASSQMWKEDIQKELDRLIFLITKMYYLDKLMDTYRNECLESKVIVLEKEYFNLRSEADGLLYNYEINENSELVKVINFYNP